MKFIIQVIAIVILAYIAESFLPWYSLAIAAAIAGYFLKSKANFLAGFLAIGFLWFIKAGMIDSDAAVDLAGKVALIFPLKEKNLLMLVTACLGAIVGGFATLTGSLLRTEKKRNYY